MLQLSITNSNEMNDKIEPREVKGKGSCLD